MQIIKIPRSGPIPDIPCSFPKLEYLRLDLIEDKRKLKKKIK